MLIQSFSLLINTMFAKTADENGVPMGDNAFRIAA